MKREKSTVVKSIRPEEWSGELPVGGIGCCTIVRPVPQHMAVVDFLRELAAEFPQSRLEMERAPGTALECIIFNRADGRGLLVMLRAPRRAH